MKWNGDNWTIQNMTWLEDERSTLLVWNVSWNTGDLDEIIGSIVNQSIIRYNYFDKFSYLKLKDECIDENKSKCYVQNGTKLPAGSLVDHLFRNR